MKDNLANIVLILITMVFAYYFFIKKPSVEKGKTASERIIKRAYYRNYNQRRGRGVCSRHLVADQIAHYLLLNNLI